MAPDGGVVRSERPGRAAPDFALEDLLCARLALGPQAPVAGIDEAGRGPWAGPVVAAAVVLDRGRVPAGLADSKQLTAARRAALYDEIIAVAAYGIGIGEVPEIDEIGVGKANDRAMARALAALPCGPLAALVDGRRVPPGLGCTAEAAVKGDARSLSVAAASILAKVTRDRIMTGLAAQYPGYGWERNAGYGTSEHQAALARLGVTPLHRRSFRPIHKILSEENATTL